MPKVADILAQLLQMDDPVELNCVNAALVSLLRVHAKGESGLPLWVLLRSLHSCLLYLLL